MNINIYKYTLILMLLLGFMYSNSQTFEIRTAESDYGYLTVQMRETSGTGTPTTSTNVVDITFVVRYPSGSVDIDLICASNDYNIIDGLGGEQTSSGYDYHYWNASNTPFNPPSSWTQNVWEDIAIFKATSATGSGLFEIAPDTWAGRSLNWNQEGTDYPPTINGDVTYSFPTIVYDYVWTGAANTQWDNGGNWLSECGTAISTAPNTGNNCIIPSGLSNYPNEVNLAQYGGHQPTCTDLKIVSGASLTLDEKDVTTLDLVWTFANVTVDGILTSIPNTRLTVSGSTTINSAEGIIVQADATGVGSFIDNGITYGASGTAKVQTYLSNSASSGNFYIHLVGPTVDEENYTGSGTGSFLQAFAINSSTYAYEWDQSMDTTGGVSGWQNIYSNTFEVNTGKGIGLSTIDAANHTLEMIGELITGSISSPNLSYGTNNLELISNPYPSAIDFDALASANSGVVNNKYWIWDPTGPNYVARASGSGGAQFIQVGQGFFVQTNSNGTFDFTNANRSHSTDPFRSNHSNELTIKAFGGQNGYHDELVVRYDETATSGYDIEIEAKKWESQNSDATQIKTVAEDNTELAINVLPLESLNNGVTSVPMHFNCGYNTEYTLSFFDMETFEVGSEIWLEDKLIGGDWISIDDNPEYSFTATPNDSEDRFVLHFFGPTSVDEFGIENTVDIYGYRQYAFVRNNTNEIIKEISIYTLAGELLRDIETVDNNINKYWVSDKLGYYVVRIITDKNVYTNKVFISK
ncbi:MAG: T9SS type A sorting domain-containing protein [Bacteroidetes bacterium]|nr:T9SS type A sorting domain-containing protein [Bacteroidota bacterium]